MKVKIGNYRHRWISKIYTRYMKKKYGLYWGEKQTRFENLLEKVEDCLQWIYDHSINLILDKRADRKVSIRIDKWDVWSMDHTLSLIILPMLKQLKETKHGSPFIDDEDVPEELRSTNAPPKKHEWDIDDNHHARWEWILDEMIWTFEQKCRDWWQEDYIIEHAEIDFDDKEEVDYEGETYYELKWKEKGKYDREGEKAHQERMSNGFRLFGKYFESLWD